VLKVGNIIGECLFYYKQIYLFIDKLEKQIGFGASGKIFKSTNVRTNEAKVIKAIQIFRQIFRSGWNWERFVHI
jgi:hypothetical protein